MPETKLPAPGVGELTALLPSWRLHLGALNLCPGTHPPHRRQGSGGRVRPQGMVTAVTASQTQREGIFPVRIMVIRAASYSVRRTCPAGDLAAAAAGTIAIASAATRTPAASAAMSQPGSTGTATTPGVEREDAPDDPPGHQAQR